MELNWIPRSKNVLVLDDEYNKTEKKTILNLGLVDASSLSDEERIRYGGTSKAAEMANKNQETQTEFLIVAVGPDCVYQVGDKIICQAGAQGHSLKIGNDYYLQVGEYDILGKAKDATKRIKGDS